MGAARDTVNRLYAITLEHPDVASIRPLIDPDITFAGPLQRTEGADAYLELNRQLLPLHVATRMHSQFERGDEVCSIYEMDLRTPSGEVLDVPMADWIRVRDGRVAAQVLYYDPRPFGQAFGL